MSPNCAIWDSPDKFDPDHHLPIMCRLDGIELPNYCSDQLATILLSISLPSAVSWPSCTPYAHYSLEPIRWINSTRLSKFWVLLIKRIGHRDIKWLRQKVKCNLFVGYYFPDEKGISLSEIVPQASMEAIDLI